MQKHLMYFVVVNLGYPGGAVYAADHPEIGPLRRRVLGQSNLRFGRRRPLSALKCALRRHGGLRRRPMNRAFFSSTGASLSIGPAR
jgi:hypothetical protein